MAQLKSVLTPKQRNHFFFEYNLYFIVIGPHPKLSPAISCSSKLSEPMSATAFPIRQAECQGHITTITTITTISIVGSYILPINLYYSILYLLLAIENCKLESGKMPILISSILDLLLPLGFPIDLQIIKESN